MTNINELCRENVIYVLQYCSQNFANSERLRNECGVPWRDLWTPGEDSLCVYTTETLRKMLEEVLNHYPFQKDEWQKPDMFLPNAEEIRQAFRDKEAACRVELIAGKSGMNDREEMLAYLGESTLKKRV